MAGGVKVPLVGLGTYMSKDEELENALEAALEIGYRHVDTGTLYENEHTIGKVLNKWFKTGKLKREDVYITCQLPMTHVHPDLVEPCLKESLQKLQLDYVDVYLIHFPIHLKEVEPGQPLEGLPTDHLGVWKKMEEQVDVGRTRSIGIANFNADQIGRILKNSRIKPSCTQIELHIYNQQKDLVKYCQENNIFVVSYSSLGAPGTDDFGRDHSAPNLLRDPVASKIAQKHNKTIGQVLLRFWTQRNIAVIPKSVKPNRVRENFNNLSFKLDSDDLKDLEDLDKGEEGRIFRTEIFNPALKDHPENPHKK